VQRRDLLRPDVAIGLLCALGLVVVTERRLLGSYGPSGQVEVAAVVLYAASVWLAVKRSILTWPTGIAAKDPRSDGRLVTMPSRSSQLRSAAWASPRSGTSSLR
jgi:hypothetical protein